MRSTLQRIENANIGWIQVSFSGWNEKFYLPGYKFDTSVNGTHKVLTNKSAIAKLPMNLLVNVRICGDLVTTIKTAMFPIIPITLIELYDILKVFVVCFKFLHEWLEWTPSIKRIVVFVSLCLRVLFILWTFDAHYLH